ncbi:hypothetical protein midi_01050 [Candidatus Midichloria mitochondrii IricVA]|uniref:Uncharacterized protein n=1 Tax=Midichloria mitochondrii (strain IricVA) TaxID=696127 RepID=F7XTW8_MIDMI|nr:hypothetical protein midi_01050 [Candidatus Midichloria mitochondrii IricVA]
MLIYNVPQSLNDRFRWVALLPSPTFKINNFTRSSINSNPYKGVLPLPFYMCTARQSLGPRYP